MSKVVELGPRTGGKSPRVNTISMLESSAGLWERLAKIGPGRFLLGFPRYEELVQPCPHQYVLLAGRPGMFKSTVAWIWAVNLASTGKRVLWLGVDMSADRLTAWAISRRTGIPYRTLVAHGRGQRLMTSSELRLVAEAEKVFSTLPLVQWCGSRITIQEMREAMLRAPYDAVFLDYLQLVQTTPGAKEPDRVSAVSDLLRQLKDDHPIHLVALSQMNREIERVQGGKPRLPNLSDLKGSGQLEADADVVVFMHRPDAGPNAPRDRIQMRVEKNRDGPDGVVTVMVAPGTKHAYEPSDAVPMDLPGTEEPK